MTAHIKSSPEDLIARIEAFYVDVNQQIDKKNLSYDGWIPLSETAVKSAIELIKTLALVWDELPPIHVYPTWLGFVQFEIDIDDHYLEATVNKEGYLTIATGNTQNENAWRIVCFNLVDFPEKPAAADYILSWCKLVRGHYAAT